MTGAPCVSQQQNAELQWSALRLVFLDRLWVGLLLVALLAVPVSVARFMFTGWRAVYTVHLVFLALVVGVYLQGRRLGYGTRAVILLALLDFAAIAGVLSFGLLGSAWWWMLMAGLLSGMLFTQRVGVMHTSLGVSFLLAVATAFSAGLLTLGFDANAYVLQPLAWATMLCGPVFFTICGFWAISVFFDAAHAQILELDQRRAQQRRLIDELETSLAEVKTLRGMIPICSHCKNIRDDRGYWESVEAFVSRHTDAQFSHGLCPTCGKQLYGELWDDALRAARARGDSSA